MTRATPRYNFRDHTLPAIWEDLRQWSQPAVRDGDEGPAYISATTLRVDYHKGSIDDAADARRYLAALKSAIEQALADSKRVRV
jgi:hypothetical protein